MGTLTSYVGAVDAANSAENGSAGFSWINITHKTRLNSRPFGGGLVRSFFRTMPRAENSEHECTADDDRARAPSAQRVRARRELRSEPLAAAQRALEPRVFHA